MSKKKKSEALTTKLPPGRKRRHGGHTYLMTGRLPEHRRYMEAFLTWVRTSLILERGPAEQDLSAGEILLIDRVVAKTGVLRCMEEAVKEGGVMQGKRLAPVLRESYLAYSNSLRLDLQALGIDKKRADKVLTIEAYTKAFDTTKAKAEATATARKQAQVAQVIRQDALQVGQDKNLGTSVIEAPSSTSSDIPKAED